MLAKVDVTPKSVKLPPGGQQAFDVALSGILATINDAAPTWQNLVGCALQADGSLKKTTSQIGFGDAGATSQQSIASGDGYVNFVANVPPAIPEITYPEFGGRAFFAGLTNKTNVTNYPDIDFAVQVFQGGVVIYESGVMKRNVRAPRNNGVYQIGIEDGVVIWRADGEIIYRSGTPITYPQRFGVAFFHGNTDYIGGNPVNPVSFKATDLSSDVAYGSWMGNTWHAPTTPGRYRIRAMTANYVFGDAFADVQALFPWPQSGWDTAFKFLELPPVWRTNEQEFDDLAADYNTPFNEPMRKWRIEFRNLSKQRAAILDNFYEAHQGQGKAFYFYDYRKDTTFDNCRITRYDKDHNVITKQRRTIEITRRPD